MAVAWKSFRNREIPRYPLEKVSINSPALSSVTVWTATGQSLHGRLKNLIYKAPNLTTDTTVVITITDADLENFVVYTSAAVADNTTAEIIIAEAAVRAFAGDNYTVKITWTTSQSPAVLDFALALHFEI